MRAHMNGRWVNDNSATGQRIILVPNSWLPGDPLPAGSPVNGRVLQEPSN